MGDEKQRFYDRLPISLPVAYFDETFRLDGQEPFFILACSLVRADVRDYSRSQIQRVLPDEVPHASEMYRDGRRRSLESVTKVLSRLNDGIDVIVYQPLEAGDSQGMRARSTCVKFALDLIAHDVEEFAAVFDRNKNPAINESDRRAIRELKRREHLSADFNFAHFRPSQEPLLALADFAAWTYRQEFVGNGSHYFEPFRSSTLIHAAKSVGTPLAQ